MKLNTAWQKVPKKPDYEWAGWRAVYDKTIRGYGSYKIYRPDGTLYAVGGLPSWVKESP